jgi:hypothetical protein
MGRATRQTGGQRSAAYYWERRETGFTAIENSVFTDEECSNADRLVYLTLSFHASRQGYCYPSIRRICSLSRLSKTTVLASINRLISKAYIRRTKGSWDAGKRRSNEYTLPLRQQTDRPILYQTQVPTHTSEGTEAYQEQYSLQKDTKKKNPELSRYEQFLNNLTLPYRICINKTVIQMLRHLETNDLLDPNYIDFVSEREKSSGNLITALQTDQYRSKWVKEKTKCSECGCFDHRHLESCSILATLSKQASLER